MVIWIDLLAVAALMVMDYFQIPWLWFEWFKPMVKRFFMFGLLIQAQLFGYVYFVLSGIQ